jgi:drug/metabolite transporter (DMT)-like permease
MFYSFIFSILGLLTIIIAQGKSGLLKEYKARDFVRMAYMGTLGCYLYNIFLFGAISHAPAQEAFIVNYLWPIMVVIFAILILKEKLTYKKLLGLILSFIGVYFVATKGRLLHFTFSNAKGDILAILGAVSYGLFSVLGKKHKYETLTSMLLYYCFGFILVLITVFAFSSVPEVSLTQLAGLAWLGIMTNALAYVFWFKSLEYGDTARMANIIFLTPFLSLVFIFFLVGEPILTSSIMGLVLIVSGIVIQESGKLR